MTDLVHMMYGKENVYGIVSQPKPTKAGINVYLSGFLKEENVRFREHAIKFDVRPPGTAKKTDALTGWKGIGKSFGKFRLKSEAGHINRHEVLGVLGENGTGKTSFVKLLAGVEKPDSGDVDRITRISYKPQYLNSSDELVAMAVKDAVAKYDVQLVRPLKLKGLLMKKLSELSGGQLQRVAIAKCLSQDADLFLLDEPSAYLDVEQRLVVSKVIKEMAEHRGASALVVDHDLLFIDYLSDSIMVFDGIPAVCGEAKGPFSMEEGMNRFLNDIKMTFRRDEESKRPRANKPGSQMDQKQKTEGKLYYS